MGLSKNCVITVYEILSQTFFDLSKKRKEKTLVNIVCISLFRVCKKVNDEYTCAIRMPKKPIREKKKKEGTYLFSVIISEHTGLRKLIVCMYTCSLVKTFRALANFLAVQVICFACSSSTVTRLVDFK